MMGGRSKHKKQKPVHGCLLNGGCRVFGAKKGQTRLGEMQKSVVSGPSKVAKKTCWGPRVIEHNPNKKYTLTMKTLIRVKVNGTPKNNSRRFKMHIPQISQILNFLSGMPLVGQAHTNPLIR